LFVVPAVIVIIIVLVWLLFNWLAQMGSDPTKYVAALRSNSKARWQAAASLADVLNDTRNAELKRDQHLAQELATLLTDELQEPNDGEEQEMLDIYLCRVLGEFAVPEAAPPLLAAAGSTRAEDIAVRRAALEGLTILSANLAKTENPHQQQIDEVLAKAAADADPQIRSVAAFALGVVGNEPSRVILRKLLQDLYPDVRYNAATGLARQHDSAGLSVILEMLDPNEDRSLQLEGAEESREFKRSLITENGLQAALVIFGSLTADQQESLRAAIELLTKEKQPADIRLKATEALRLLGK